MHPRYVEHRGRRWGVSGELKSVLLERSGRSADQSGRPLGEHDRTYASACATPTRRPTSVFIEGMSVRQWLESSGCVARDARAIRWARQRALPCGADRRCDLGTDRPSPRSCPRQQSVRTLRGDVEHQVGIVHSQGLVECRFEVLDVDAQHALGARVTTPFRSRSTSAVAPATASARRADCSV
jgi:hypothetical protein